MLIDNDFVKAEHKYRGEKLSDIYPRKARPGGGVMTRAERSRSRPSAVKRLAEMVRNERRTGAQMQP